MSWQPIDTGQEGTCPPSRDRGGTLIEIVMTVTLMAIVLVPVLQGVIAAIGASSQSNNSAQTETVILNAADRVNRAPKRCDYTVYVQAAALSQGWSADRAVVQQYHYVPGPTPAAPGTWVSGACDGITPTDLLVQRVDIVVTSPDGRSRRSIQVVKSDV